jgi:hypothetical protein
VLAPPCELLDEAARLDVGRGVALVELEATLPRGPRPCSIDARAALLAREEGRASPEVVGFSIELDGRRLRLGGPRGTAALEIPSGPDAPRVGARLRVRAVLRGERFVAVPLSLEPPLDALGTLGVRFRARATSPWSRFSTAATARWVDRGVPALVFVDTARDREPLQLDVRVRKGGVATMVVDAGAQIDAPEDPAARLAELARGGATTLTAIATDVPLAIATAPDAASAVARLREAAAVALVASRASDPLLAAVGQRLASAIARGFDGCRREPGSVPAAWPAAAAELVDSGLLDDDDAGCPRVDHLLLGNHADVHFEREGRAALLDVLGRSPSGLPSVAPLFAGATPRALGAHVDARGALRHRRNRGLLLALLFVVASAASALLLRRFARETL